MARIKLGAFITEISGSLGGQSIQKNRSGVSIKTKVNNVDQASQAQLEQRSIMLAVQNAWRSLSDEQRKAWHFSIDFYKTVSLKDSSVHLSGRELFIRWNILLMSAGLSIVTTPDFNSSYEIDSDFSLYADDLSFFAVFDSDPTAVEKSFLLNMSRSAPSYYSPSRSSIKRIDSVNMGDGGFDLKESFISQHAVLPKVNENVSGVMRQFSKAVPISSAPKRFAKSVLPISLLHPGHNFSLVASPSADTSVFSSIRCSNGSVIMGTSPNAHIYKSVNNGLNFYDVGVLPYSTIVRCLVQLDNGVLLAGTGSLGHIFYSLDYGSSWFDIGRLFNQGQIFSLCYLGNGIVLAGTGPNGYILRSTDFGLHWSNIGQQFSQGQIYSLCYLGNGIVLAGTGPNGYILRSTDFGLHWSNIGQQFSQTQILSLHFSSSGCVLAGCYPGGLILRSPDLGLSWSSSGNLYSEMRFITFLEYDSNYIFAGSGQNGLLVLSTDNGFTWANLGNLYSQSNILCSTKLPNGSFLLGSSLSGLIIRSNIFPNA